MVYEIPTTSNLDQVQAKTNIELGGMLSAVGYRCYSLAGTGNISQQGAIPKWSSGINAPGKIYLILTLTLILCFHLGPFDCRNLLVAIILSVCLHTMVT